MKTMAQIPGPNPKWEAKVCTSLTKAKADQIWPLFKDFFNLHKYFPPLNTCYRIHGTNGEPGCIRYCAGGSLPSNGGGGGDDDQPAVSWSTERLVAVHDVDHCLSYEIVDCNIGFESYFSTVKIVPARHGPQVEGCVIEWSFTVDPVEGWVFGDLVKKYEVGLQIMAKRMEETVLQSLALE